jgi:hypothetical protein
MDYIQHDKTDKPKLICVGSTKDFNKRRCRHKNNCNNKHYLKYTKQFMKMEDGIIVKCY